MKLKAMLHKIGNKFRDLFPVYSGLTSHNRHRIYRLVRKWSNNELKKVAGVMTGDVINISGWKDMDKEGNIYRTYFSNASSYTISNYYGERGLTGINGEIFLDLTVPLSPEYHNQYDVVFNHTTLEHIFEVEIAFSNLCLLSRDIVILVLPFLQPTHVTPSFDDYWRFTPQGVRSLFINNGFDVIYENASNYYYSAVYLFFIASCKSEKWIECLPSQFLPSSDVGSNAFGHPPFILRLLKWFG